MIWAPPLLRLPRGRSRTLCAIVAVPVATAACASASGTPAQQPTPAPVSVESSGHIPHRVYDVGAAAFTDFETLVARSASAAVVFFGERHGHAPGHRLQHALLEGLFRRGGATLSLEMFERDVAPLLRAYAARELDAARFVADARPWPRYETDYRPQVDFARHVGWRVIAANVPRTLAALVAQDGLDALAGLDRATRAHAAADIQCPDDAYRARFIAEMRRHPMGDELSAEAVAAIEQRYYESQCVKDETMAESIAAVLATDARRPIVHLTGAFHTDHRDGVPVRLLRRMPAVTTLSITLVPVADLDDIDPAPHLARADYLLFTLER